MDNKKKTHSKTKGLPVFSGAPQPYILSKNLRTEEIQTLFKVKNRMIEVFDNFRNGNSSKWCKTCFLFLENQHHLYNCFVIHQELKDSVDFASTSYSDKDGNLLQQEKFAKNYTKVLEARQLIIERNAKGLLSPQMGTRAPMVQEVFRQ